MPSNEFVKQMTENVIEVNWLALDTGPSQVM